MCDDCDRESIKHMGTTDSSEETDDLRSWRKPPTAERVFMNDNCDYSRTADLAIRGEFGHGIPNIEHFVDHWLGLGSSSRWPNTLAPIQFATPNLELDAPRHPMSREVPVGEDAVRA